MTIDVMNSYYVYALKDPTVTPARPFYIGKGTGIRAWEHEINIDRTRKGKRVEQIKALGKDIIVSILAENLTEIQAYKLESELISAFGVEKNGGFLTNSVVPTGVIKKAPKNINVPLGVLEKAQLGLSMLKASIVELIQANPTGITNSDAVKALGLQSDFQGGSKDYLSFSILGLLIRERKIKRKKDSRRYLLNVDRGE